MKKSILLMGCLALLMAGCNKEQNIEEPQQEAPRHLTFDIAVNYSDDTRAVKTEWEENDKIYVFFDFDETTTSAEYLTMTYDGSSWSHEFSNETMEAGLLEKTEGKLYAVFFPIGTPNFTVSQPLSYMTLINFSFHETNIVNYFRINYSSSLEVPYEIDADGKLTAELNMSLGTKDIQFFVPGISEADNYSFSCNQMYPTRPSSLVYNSNTGQYAASYSIGGLGIDVKGYYYKDGLVFSGQLVDSANGVSQDYEFTVKDTKGTADESDDVKYTLAFSGKTLVYHDAVKLPALNSGRWTIEGPNYINGHEYVDMGDGLKWATMNVGASSVTEYGDFFSWAETEPKNDYQWPTYKYLREYVEGHATQYLNKYTIDDSYGGIWHDDSGRFIGDNKTTLEPQDDAATANWGATWRTPTKSEWQWLIDNCIWVWETKNGKNGYTVTSNIDGFTGNSIFLPAAGYQNGTNHWYPQVEGVYWSSSLSENDSSRATTLVFKYLAYSGNYIKLDPSYGDRDGGRSVRAVSD